MQIQLSIASPKVELPGLSTGIEQLKKPVTTPCPITAEEVGINLTQRLKMMETQGYWKDCRMRQIPIEQVTYLVVAAEEETEEEDD